MCIDRSTDVCDGENDCPDGFDEQQCFVPVDDSSDAATSGLGCGGTLSAPPDGSVTSPNYPENYKPDQTCGWLITVPEGSSVRLTFDSFHVEDGYDYLYIYDGDSDSATELQKLTGELSIDPITSTSNKMFVKFDSDESETTQGFQVSYTATPVDLTTEVQVEPTTPPGDLTTEVLPGPTTPPGDLTTEVQADPTTPPGDLKTKVQADPATTPDGQFRGGMPDPTTPPSGLTNEVQPEPTEPVDDTTGMEENGESGASVATTVPGSALAVIALAHLVLTYCGMFG
ncbi:PREDICTED: bone morphogenetic protein 1-like [Branchiostoma belcheri]|uniref:Bone morphogenetic protein 1-like n=1 Tax=Branchiostoma belcheri TaxID=7741 RepID=A0A6P4XNF5_BRABE|nr:PREDICTED: bone morphogenetic protein 1-like [Branchiostoma belcheri]